LLRATQWISNCALTADFLAYLTHNASVEAVAMTTTRTPTLDPIATGKLILTALASQLWIVLLKVMMEYSPTNALLRGGAGTAVPNPIASQESN